jgi:hypothetical protein
MLATLLIRDAAIPPTTAAAATPPAIAIPFLRRAASRPVMRSATFVATPLACDPAFFAVLNALLAIRTAAAAVVAASPIVSAVCRTDFLIRAILSSQPYHSGDQYPFLY